MRLTISDLGLDGLFGGTGADADTVLFSKEYETGNTAWAQYTSFDPGVGSINTLGNTMRFAYEAVSAAGGLSQANFY